ncbi:GNAT family N-acetyltransferase [Alkalihalobacillus hwajinpoensis]|uniref:GNAT family N-acetyltransferase n=1 Tax=Guptibacillus hwajinpoensis TaxID=208199 RepID=UPI0018848D1D|nr:GNAT family N-acetyltransferase [Pseudalkalibacillus hwajinpoensis]MBF0707429.1 GNAT family N-acetyltransferase [Pseudalkalibacillus hwajinpoensis]
MNVALRLVNKDDLPLIQKYVSSEAVSRMTNVPDPYPPNGAEKWFAIVSEEHKAGKHFPFAIVVDGNFAGSISVRREREGVGAIDYWVAPPFWKRSIGTKAAERAIEFGKKELGFTMFETVCLVENRGSARVLEKVGFQEGKEFQIRIGEKHEGKMARTYDLNSLWSSI